MIWKWNEIFANDHVHKSQMKLNYERNDDTESVATTLRRFIFLYFIIAAESVAETSEHGIQTNGEQRALNVVGIGFKPWIFWKLLKVPQNLFSLRKKVSRSSRWINEKKKTRRVQMNVHEILYGVGILWPRL